MSDSDSRMVIRVMRAQAWQRAKGELMSILETYWKETEQFERMSDLTQQFISAVQDEGLAE